MNDISLVNIQTTLIEFVFALLFTETSSDHMTNKFGSRAALSAK